MHYLNPAPINEIEQRWINQYDRERIHALGNLKLALEDTAMENPKFVYKSYITTSPERLCGRRSPTRVHEAVLGGVGFETDWKVGSDDRLGPPRPITDPDQVVLESDPYGRLSYTWHTFTPELAEAIGVDEEVRALAAGEPRSKVTFEIEPAGSAVQADGDPRRLRARTANVIELIGGGWPRVSRR